MALQLNSAIAQAKNLLSDPGRWLALLEIDTPALDEPLKLVRNTEDISWPEEDQDLTGYTETDPNNRFTVIADKITVNGLTRNEDAYVYYDFGAANTYFDGSFEIWATVKITAADNNGIVFGPSLTNIVDDWHGIDTANGDALSVELCRQAGYGGYAIALFELDGGTFHYDLPYTIAVDTTYYLRFVRDETDDTDYGTLYCYIYSDAARETLLDTLSLALHSSKKDFRYLYGAQSYNDTNAVAISAEISDLEIYNRWQAFPYELDEAKMESDGSIQSLIARVGNATREVEGYVNEADGGKDTTATVCVVYSPELALTDAIIEEIYEVGEINCDSMWAAFELLADTFWLNRFPRDVFSRNVCRHKFKDRYCGYTGAESECDHTMENCLARSNVSKFGACPGIPNSQFDEAGVPVSYID